MSAQLTVAIRALGQVRGLQSIMSAAGGSAALRVATFRIRHTSTFFFSILSRMFLKCSVRAGAELGTEVLQLVPAIIDRRRFTAAEL
jgi:hypothetical protein